MSEETPARESLPRRAIVKGAAWSVPIVATAIATPLASASTAVQLDNTRHSAVSSTSYMYRPGSDPAEVYPYFGGGSFSMCSDEGGPALSTGPLTVSQSWNGPGPLMVAPSGRRSQWNDYVEADEFAGSDGWIVSYYGVDPADSSRTMVSFTYNAGFEMSAGGGCIWMSQQAPWVRASWDGSSATATYDWANYPEWTSSMESIPHS